MNYKNIKKGKIYENSKGTEQLKEGTLFKTIVNQKRYYDDINGENIDVIEEIEKLLNTEYLPKNDNDNDEKCCTKLVFKDLKRETILGNNEETIKRLKEEDLSNITNKKLINIIINKLKN